MSPPAGALCSVLQKGSPSEHACSPSPPPSRPPCLLLGLFQHRSTLHTQATQPLCPTLQPERAPMGPRGLQPASPGGGLHRPLAQTNPSSTSFQKKIIQGVEELCNPRLIMVSFLSRGCRLPAGACSRSDELLEPGRTGCLCNRSHFLCLLLPNRHLPGSSLAFPQRSQCVGAWEAGVKLQEHPSRLTVNVPSAPGHAAYSRPSFLPLFTWL